MKIHNKHYESQYIEISNIISNWVSPYIKINDSRILDFGCGDAASALGFAINHKAKEVFGVEVKNKLDSCIQQAELNLNITEFPE